MGRKDSSPCRRHAKHCSFILPKESVKHVLFWHQELTEDLRRLTKDIKAVEVENESLSQQLKESLAKLDDLSQTQPDVNSRQNLLGTMLEEKFNLEKKVMYIHFFERAVDLVKPKTNYRLRRSFF